MSKAQSEAQEVSVYCGSYMSYISIGMLMSLMLVFYECIPGRASLTRDKRGTLKQQLEEERYLGGKYVT